MEIQNENLSFIQKNRLYFEYDEPLKDFRKGALRKALYISIFVVFVSCLLGLFIKYPKIVTLKFVIKSEFPDYNYVLDHRAYLIENYVHPGQVVHYGDSLMKISSDKILNIIYALNKLLIQKKIIERKNAELLPIDKNIIITETQKVNSQFKSEEDKRKFVLQYYNTQIKKNLKDRNLIEAEYNRNLQLYKEGVISKSEFEIAQKNKLEAEAEIMRNKLLMEEKLIESNNSLQTYSFNIKQRNEQITKQNIEHSITYMEIQMEVESLHNQLQELLGNYRIDKDGKIVILSSTNGFVNYIHEKEMVVESGQSWIQIGKRDNKFYALCNANSNNISKINNDQLVYLKVDAFPFTEFGFIKGKVIHVSQMPNYDGHYQFEISFEKLIPNIILRHGMTGEAVIHTDEKSFWQHVFYKFKSHIQF